MNYRALKTTVAADFSLVEIVDGKPSCKLHGAMNKVTADGIWRCITQYKKEKDWYNAKGSLVMGSFVERTCHAACEEETEEEKKKEEYRKQEMRYSVECMCVPNNSK